MHPTFVATNGCLSDKKDRALSLCLLAAVKVSDKEYKLKDDTEYNESYYTDVVHNDESSNDDGSLMFKKKVNIFYNNVIRELKLMGVENPLKSIKENGVGRETLEYVIERFLFSTVRNGICPATVSVIGAIAAQEVRNEGKNENEERGRKIIRILCMIFFVNYGYYDRKPLIPSLFVSVFFN